MPASAAAVGVGVELEAAEAEAAAVKAVAAVAGAVTAPKVVVVGVGVVVVLAVEWMSALSTQWVAAELVVQLWRAARLQWALHLAEPADWVLIAALGLALALVQALIGVEPVTGDCRVGRAWLAGIAGACGPVCHSTSKHPPQEATPH